MRIYGDFMWFLFSNLINLELTSCAVIGFVKEMLKSGELLPRPLLSYINTLPCYLIHSKKVLFLDHSFKDVPDPF